MAASGPRRTITATEWIAAAVSVAIVLAALTVLVMHARTPRTPPDLTVAVDAIEPASSGFLVRFVVANHGGSTAAQAIVRGAVVAGGEHEEAEVTFDFVPDGSTRKGGLLFTRDPRAGKLTVRVLGYREP